MTNPTIKATLKPSPSLVYNNLCPLSSGGVAYAHQRQIVTVDSLPTSSGRISDAKRVETQDTSAVQMVASCVVGDMNLVVLGNSTGLQVWDDSGVALLYVWRLPRSRSDPQQATASDFVRGLGFCLAADGSVCLCAGSSSGVVYCFHVSEGPIVRPCGDLVHHVTAVTALGSAYQSRRGAWAEDLGCELVSADEAGKVVVWEARQAGQHRLVRSMDVGDGMPCCSLAVRNGSVICGRADGSIRVYGLHNGQLQTEIVAHSRWLSGMDIHPTKDMLATCSEDCTLGLWTLPAGSTRAANLLSVCWVNALVTGVAFCGSGSNDLAAVAYDQDEISIWTAAAG